ncbi:MAG TPA: glycoside hydrolase family 15 protein [Actinomycetota bacterium]|nr:glycoside hydrolase family 15 protein [Actinomycetota bacterium]
MSAAPYPPIEDYALLSDCHSSVLVSRAGSVDWGVLRRFDGPPAFARVLDWERGGHCELAPVGGVPAARRYDGDTLVLVTEQRAGAALGRTTDFLAIEPTSPTAERAVVAPEHDFVRIAEAVDGTTEWVFTCRPRFEYGIVVPQATTRGERSGLIVGGPQALSVHASVPLEAGDGELTARFRLAPGERAWFVVSSHLPHRVEPRAFDDGVVERHLEHTRDFWTEWASRCTYRGSHRDAVVRSALTLKALTNAPTGAIVAAPTTSLPEAVGGERNWDYRYCWIRDASFTLYALFILGYRAEAHAFIEWLMRTTAGRARDLQVLYGIGGERLLPEIALDHLDGYRGSRPVRIGNAASRQLQLDVYGAILDTAHLWRRHGGDVEPEFWDLLQGCVGEIEARWREPDEGIWEVRGGRRHFVYSKVMCWVGLDRAIKAAGALGIEGSVARWRALRDEIHADVLAHGFDRDAGAFVQAYGSPALDASALLLPLVGFLPASDPRIESTVDAIAASLTRDGLVYRYLVDDGIPGGEGTFTICSFWMVDNLALLGRTRAAHALFDRLCGYANDVGLLGEEIDPDTGAHLGNFPQAFTHLALVNSALNLERLTPVADAAGPVQRAGRRE